MDGIETRVELTHVIVQWSALYLIHDLSTSVIGDLRVQTKGHLQVHIQYMMCV